MPEDSSFRAWGIGKTQIALEVAQFAMKDSPEYSVFSVLAVSLESFE